MSAKREYEVGKGKPPKHTQFPKGQSGNPTGRPGPAKSLQRRFWQKIEAALDGDYLDLKCEVGALGGRTALDKLARAIVLSAAQGESRKIGILLPLLERLDRMAGEGEGEAESVSLPQGKRQGKNENLPEPNPESNREQEPPKPVEPEKPMIIIGGRRVQ